MNLDAERQKLLGLADEERELEAVAAWIADAAALIHAQDEENRQLRRVIDKMASRPSTDKELLLAKQYGEALQMIEQQAAELERLRADAERYRWLTANYSNGLSITWATQAYTPEQLDAAIDAAIAAERKGAG